MTRHTAVIEYQDDVLVFVQNKKQVQVKKARLLELHVFCEAGARNARKVAEDTEFIILK